MPFLRVEFSLFALPRPLFRSRSPLPPALVSSAALVTALFLLRVRRDGNAGKGKAQNPGLELASECWSVVYDCRPQATWKKLEHNQGHVPERIFNTPSTHLQKIFVKIGCPVVALTGCQCLWPLVPPTAPSSMQVQCKTEHFLLHCRNDAERKGHGGGRGGGRGEGSQLNVFEL